jgi:hypothetical protein
MKYILPSSFYPLSCVMQGIAGPIGPSGIDGIPGSTGERGPTGPTGTIDSSAFVRIIGSGDGSGVTGFCIPVDTTNNSVIEVYISYSSDGREDLLQISDDCTSFPRVTACSTPQAANNVWNSFVGFQSSSNALGVLINLLSINPPSVTFVKATIPQYIQFGTDRRQSVLIDSTSLVDQIPSTGGVAVQIRGAVSYTVTDLIKQVNYLRIVTKGTNISYYSYIVVAYQ